MIEESDSNVASLSLDMEFRLFTSLKTRNVASFLKLDNLMHVHVLIVKCQ